MRVGKGRHLELRELWIQEQVAQKRLHLEKIPGSSNEADIMTKQLKGQQLFEMLCESLGEHGEEAAEEVQNCVEVPVLHDQWRRRIERLMLGLGYEPDLVEETLRQISSDDEASIVFSQLMVVTCS